VNCDFDARFVKPGIEGGPRGCNVRHLAGFVQCPPYAAYARVTRRPAHADRSGTFSYAEGGSLIPAAFGDDRCPVACGKLASRNIQRADFHGA